MIIVKLVVWPRVNMFIDMLYMVVSNFKHWLVECFISCCACVNYEKLYYSFYDANSHHLLHVVTCDIKLTC